MLPSSSPSQLARPTLLHHNAILITDSEVSMEAVNPLLHMWRNGRLTGLELQATNQPSMRHEEVPASFVLLLGDRMPGSVEHSKQAVVVVVVRMPGSVEHGKQAVVVRRHALAMTAPQMAQVPLGRWRGGARGRYDQA
jgi:hypothetical protein